jgi:predicted phosphodiesterase
MKILIVSDVHFELDYHRNVWEGEAKDWLLKVIKRQQPTTLIMLGDSGHAWTPEDWKTITDIIETHAIFGNHDNMASLKGIRPAVNSPQSHFKRVLAEDGEVRTIEGLRFGFINGIIATKHKVRDGVPRKTAEEYLDIAKQMTNIDVLCTHLSPLELASHPIHKSEELTVMEQVRAIVRPKIHLSGHSGPFKIATVDGVFCVRVDSNQQEKIFAMLSHNGISIGIWHDTELIGQYDIPL